MRKAPDGPNRPSRGLNQSNLRLTNGSWFRPWTEPVQTVDYWFGLLVHDPRRSLACRVRLAGLEETVDLAAILNGVVSLEGACDSSDPS